VLREWPDTFAIAGNHDMTSGGLSSLWGQPIGGLHRAGALTILLDDRVVEYGGLRIQLSPANFDDNLDRDPANYALRRLKGVDWAIKMAHGMLVPPKKNPFPPNVQVTPMDTVPTTGMDICVFGHPHFDFGVKKVNGCYFVSTGALARVARRSENTDRTIRVMEVEIGAKGTQPAVRPVVLKSVRPASEVFLEKDATLSEVELEEPLRAFAKRMSAALQQDTRETLDGLIDRFGSRVKRRVRKFIHECLEEAGYV
jgi:DNA repair exonuclease SbcCD nuclease subunit